VQSARAQSHCQCHPGRVPRGEERAARPGDVNALHDTSLSFSACLSSGVPLYHGVWKECKARDAPNEARARPGHLMFYGHHKPRQHFVDILYNSSGQPDIPLRHPQNLTAVGQRRTYHQKCGRAHFVYLSVHVSRPCGIGGSPVISMISLSHVEDTFCLYVASFNPGFLPLYQRFKH
jgi:hypothetical protein